MPQLVRQRARMGRLYCFSEAVAQGPFCRYTVGMNLTVDVFLSADISIVYAIQGNTAEVDRGETAISVFEPCLADGGSSARVGGVYPYSRGSWGEGVLRFTNAVKLI